MPGLLGQRLEVVGEVVGEAHGTFGKPYTDITLVSEDGQSLHIYEGQLKEVPGARLVPGRRYRLVFQPFLNNRWVELKLVAVKPEAVKPEGPPSP